MPINNALHIAAKSGNVAQVQVEVGNFDIDTKGEIDGTALYWAARNGHKDVVLLLSTLNPDANILDASRLKIISVHQLICISPFTTLSSRYPPTTYLQLIFISAYCRIFKFNFCCRISYLPMH